ncbi:MAG: S1C family serine protease, partial [Miltoncostaeaceae bacterium]
AEGLPSLSPRAASRGGGLPPLDAAGAPRDEAPAEQRPVADAQEGTSPPPPRRGRAGRIGRAPRQPRRGGRARRATAGLIVAAALAGAMAGGATTYLLDDDPQSGVVAASGAAGEASTPGALQDAIAAVDGSVVQVRTAGGLGSGVVTAPRGLIITNEHVAGSRGDDVMVITADDRRVPATVVASDASRDLAVLRPKGSVGQGVRIAPEPDAALRPGDQVFAIGSPFGLQGTVTVGVVSAVARRGEGGAPMIQTDAPINPGNSGGGLFDLRGRLVGVPTSINSPVPGNVGIGFAVTADEVRRILGSVN